MRLFRFPCFPRVSPFSCADQSGELYIQYGRRPYEPRGGERAPPWGRGGDTRYKDAVSRPALVAGLRLSRLSHSVLCVCLLAVAHAPIHAYQRNLSQCSTRQDRHSTATACNTRQGAQAQIISDCLMRLLLGCWAGHPARRASRRRDAKKHLYGVIWSQPYKLSRRTQKTRLRTKTRKIGVFWAVEQINDRLESSISPLILAAQGLVCADFGDFCQKVI